MEKGTSPGQYRRIQAEAVKIKGQERKPAKDNTEGFKQRLQRSSGRKREPAQDSTIQKDSSRGYKNQGAVGKGSQPRTIQKG